MVPPAEVWLLYRDHELKAAFDSDAGVHMSTARWSYEDLVAELGGDLMATAFYCIRTIVAAGELTMPSR